MVIRSKWGQRDHFACHFGSAYFCILSKTRKVNYEDYPEMKVSNHMTRLDFDLTQMNQKDFSHFMETFWRFCKKMPFVLKCNRVILQWMTDQNLSSNRGGS